MASERDRSGRRSSRDERDRYRDTSDDHHKRERDYDHDREHKHRHHRRHSDKHTDERSYREDDYRRHRSRDDSPADPEPRRERSSSRARESVDRDGASREESVERRHHHQSSSRKRREHGDEEELDKTGKRVRVSDGVGDEEELDKSGKRVRVSDGAMEEKRERRHFEDRAAEDSRDLNGAYKEDRKDDVTLKLRRKDDGLKDREDDREGERVKEEISRDLEDRKPRKEGRRFSDNVSAEKKDEDYGERVDNKEKRKERRRFGDKVKAEDLDSAQEAKPSAFDVKDKTVDGQLGNGTQSNLALDESGFTANAFLQEPLTLASKALVNSASSGHPQHNKVSSITTTNENEGVGIRSDEVPGKSSTDGKATSVIGKSGSLSLDALAKAKKALQMQKELSEKLKKIPMLNKASSSTDKAGAQVHSGSSISVSASASQVTAMPTIPVAVTSSGKPPVPGSTGVIPGLTNMANIEAVKRAQELAAKMGFRQDPEFAPLINMFPGPVTADLTVPQKPAKAPVLRLDAQGREIDEHGNVINMPKLTNLSTLKVNINKQKKEAFQIIRPDLDAIAKSSSHFDERMGLDKTKLLRPKRMSFQFVEEGKWSKQAEIIKFKSQFGEAQAKELKIKQAQLAKAKAEPESNPNLIAVGVRVFKEKQKEEIPVIEWWDKPILPTGVYADPEELKINMEKLTIYVEHPLPIEPPAEPAPPPPQPLKLTKKEQKKLRTQRRLAKERDRQEMIRQGLLEPPKPKIKMSNLMKVLSSEATQDPTKLEIEIRKDAEEREQAHVDRNIARKLTPAERREKKEKKLFDDPSTLETLVSVYKIKDLSHPQTRFKVDVNAQENRLTGCAVISEEMSVVVVEGGRKSIKRYGKLMLKRINWAAAVDNEEKETEEPDGPPNSCVLVWQGSVAKPSFNRFFVHQCRSEAAARKVLADAGVPHYWDLSVNFSEDLL